MNNHTSKKLQDWEKKSIYFGILFIGVLSSLMHFLYDISGKSSFIALIAPTNESVWEHLKMVFLPTFIWWIIAYYLYAKNNNITYQKWFVATMLAIIIPQLFIVAFYYTYTGALGINSVIIDILSLFLGIIIGQFIAINYCRKIDFNSWYFYLAVILLIILVVSNIIFTFNPPHLPIFFDESTQTYGPN